MNEQEKVVEQRPWIVFEANDIEKKLKHAVYERLRQFGRSFWIVSFCPWVHPYNNVKNCFALMFDGFVYYKFQVMMIKGKKGYFFRFRVAQLPTEGKSFNMDIKLNQRLTYQQLLDKIATAKVS